MQLSKEEYTRQQVSLQKIIIVEANRALLSLKKDCGKAKGSKRAEARTQ